MLADVVNYANAKKGVSINTKISVLMAVFNGYDYLEESINSILNQSFSDFEFIIVDDGSTDGSSNLIREMSNIDSRIRYISHENCGLTKSLNVGLKHANAPLIARMDADDIANPDRLRRQYDEFCADHELVLLGSEVECISRDGYRLGTRGHEYTDERIRRRLLIGDGGALTHPAVMFRTHISEKINGYDERFSTTQDLDFFIRMSEKGQIRNLKDVLLHWRQHASSVNSTKFETWSDMKKMAIESAIHRIGLSAYLHQIFPPEGGIFVPQNSFELAYIARHNGRIAEATKLLKQALKEPSLRPRAREELTEINLLRIWWRIRNCIRFSNSMFARRK